MRYLHTFFLFIHRNLEIVVGIQTLGGVILSCLVGFMLYQNSQPIFRKEDIYQSGVLEENAKTSRVNEREEKENIGRLKQTQDKNTRMNNELVIYISGAVQTPGIHSFPKNTRVYDVFQKVGVDEEANLECFELASYIQDTQSYRVPKKGEACPTQHALPRSSSQEMSGNSSNTNEVCVSLNSASKEELMTLSSIGEAKAEAILTYRSEHPFTSLEELKDVSGIGDAIYKKIESSICI